MSDLAAPSVVGVIGDTTKPVRTAIETAGGETRTGTLATVLADDPDALVVVGEGALLELAAHAPTPDQPVLPVDIGDRIGVASAALDEIESAVAAFLAGQGTRRQVPILAAHEDGAEHARGLCDLMLVTLEQARISEYAVHDDGELVSRFRADGVVVATPAGSHGYAKSVGSPVLASETDVVSVVPIAPFTITADHWVLPTESVTLTVERDEAAVELLADDRRTGPVPATTPLSIAPVDTLSIHVAEKR